MSFKNQIKIIENDLIYLKNNYLKTHQNFIKKEILLTKQINQLQNINLSNYNYTQNKKIIKFDRNEFNDFTIIKVNNVRSK